jgi:hypothetical protein
MLVQGNALMSGFTAIRLSWSVANDGHIDLRLANHPADRRVPHAGSDDGVRSAPYPNYFNVTLGGPRLAVVTAAAE